jgi:predicted DNA-binding transcriptional regulator YafY
MFSAEECEALAVGLSLVSRTGDRGLERAARQAARKIEAALQGLVRQLDDGRLRVLGRSAVPPASIDLEAVRRAMREEHKLALDYHDEQGHHTARTVLPIAMVYYADATVLAAWCELRVGLPALPNRPDGRMPSAGGDFQGQGEGAA